MREIFFLLSICLVTSNGASSTTTSTTATGGTTTTTSASTGTTTTTTEPITVLNPSTTAEPTIPENLSINNEEQTVSSSVEIKIKQGRLSGTTEDAPDGRKFYSFMGIPYAQPPVGKLRFQDPVTASHWDGVRNGSITPPLCPQLNLTLLQEKGRMVVIGEEDCLYLNVFTPKLNSSDLPVMVWIHGGAFLVGSTTDMSPLTIVTQDVVLVTLHFRVGTLGFLSTEDSLIPGNFGLKDQTMALRWVQNNIKDFGGDRNKVTIFGNSAGAASVHFQVLTPYAKGLFQRAVVQSGSSLCSWTTRKGHRDIAFRVGYAVSCNMTGPDGNPEDSGALLDCLQNSDMDFLITMPLLFVEWSREPLVMVPRVDGDYIPDRPAALLTQNKFNYVDLMIGTTKHDGSITTSTIYMKDNDRQSLLRNFKTAGPLVLNFRDGDELPEYLARRVFAHYLGNPIDVTEQNADDVTQLYTDRLFSVCSEHTALLHHEYSPKNHRIYSYEFHHKGQHAGFPSSVSNISKDWIGHSDEWQYLWDSRSGKYPLERPDDFMMRDMMVKLWTNFAKYGNPTPNQSLGFRWLPLTNGKLQHLRITTAAHMVQDYREKTRLFWEDLPTCQNRIMFPEKFLDSPENDC